ncbi:MAG TPA: hypothetical protein PKD53_04840 [Chloroflexaceae bacterium]|nr:hypothetical protein [Chloroflexaceae bacterium]
MQFEGAVIREQGVVFAVVIVKKQVVDNVSAARETIQAFQPAFPGIPVVLMGQDSRGRATYYGRSDIVKFLSRIPVSAIPWKRYSLH